MKSVAIVLADGFEEIEAVSVIDVLRRAGANVSIVGLDSAYVRGAHDIVIRANLLLDELDENKHDMIVLPGGLPGATNLASSEILLEILARFDKHNKQIAAICAAPMVLERAKVLKNHFVCYPGFEANVRNFGYDDSKNVLTDQNITTAKGPAFSIEFALNLVKILFNDSKYNEIKNELLI